MQRCRCNEWYVAAAEAFQNTTSSYTWTHFAHIGTTDYTIGSSSYNSAVGSQAAGDSVWWLSCSAAEAAAAGRAIEMKLTMG